jgi:pyruvate formate lyase activating enzyme
MNQSPLIVEIKGNSLDDGPGIRSVVFFKGCPLSCAWCHNPECKSPRAEIMFDPSKCVACGACIAVCPRDALAGANPFYIDRARCDLCYACARECPSGALAPVGKKMAVEEILETVITDKPFYDNSGGGVTCSGGEPTMHMAFLGGLLEALKRKGVHTLIETCGLFDPAGFKELVLPFTDAIYMDLKLLDPDRHRAYCGAGNEVILDNLVALHTLSLGGKFAFLPRMPLVPGITATSENIAAAARFLKKHRIGRLQLLPYNPLWGEKMIKLGLPNPYAKDHPLMNWPPREEIDKHKAALTAHGITVP